MGVDAHVGEHIFRRAISGDVSKGTTRILVTHHVHVLSQCDKVIVMDDGKIKHMGKSSDLIEQGVDFAGAVDVSKLESKEDEENNTEIEKKEKSEEKLLPSKEKKDDAAGM